jgi:sec-independent protein translocase protein TatA
MPHISAPELLILGFLAIVFFGANKVPETAKSLGQALRAFKNEIKDVESDVKSTASVIKEEVKVEAKAA